LKGRWQEERRTDDHLLVDDSAFLDIPGGDGTWSREELSALLALNLDLRGEYVSDCQSGIKRWNKIVSDNGIDFQFALPHAGFNRAVGVFADHYVSPAGTIVDAVAWKQAESKWLPTDDDLAFVRSLMQPVYEPGKIAGWVAPPVQGINGQPFEYDYVRLA
jgi:benzoyl-CoA 2,3-dioxygenase component B